MFLFRKATMAAVCNFILRSSSRLWPCDWINISFHNWSVASGGFRDNLTNSIYALPLHSFFFPAGTRRCDNVGFWLSFGRDVRQRQSNVVKTLSFRRCCSDQNLMFRPATNVVATSCFWRHFSDKNLTVYQRHYDSLFPKLCKLSFNSSFW